MSVQVTDFLNEMLAASATPSIERLFRDAEHSKQSQEAGKLNGYYTDNHVSIFVNGEILPLRSVGKTERPTYGRESLASLISALDNGEPAYLVDECGHFALSKPEHSNHTFDVMLGRKYDGSSTTIDAKWWRISTVFGNKCARIFTSKSHGAWLCNIVMSHEFSPKAEAV